MSLYEQQKDKEDYMLRKLLIGITILIVVGIISYLGWWILIINALGGFDKDYSITELKENFENNKNEIYELKHYFNEIVPKNRFVEIEFKNGNKLFRFGIKALDSTAGDPNRPMFLEWDLKTNTERMDSIIRPMGWTNETLKALKDKLDKADCIQIEGREPTKIGFKRCGMGMYFFNVFDKPISNSMQENYNDSCTYIMVNEKPVLEYNGGAIGRQCFYNFK